MRDCLNSQQPRYPPLGAVGQYRIDTAAMLRPTQLSLGRQSVHSNVKVDKRVVGR